MNKIYELLAKLCPQGVVYEIVGNIADVGTGSSNGNEAVENGIYPFFVRSQIVKLKNDYEYDEEAIIIPGEGGIGGIYHYVSGKYALHQRVYRIHFKTDKVITKFAYYYFYSKFRGYIIKKAVNATVSSIRKPMIENFVIPVPPIEVQHEIVRILDNFTELKTELTARKKQYEYYRDSLLEFDTSISKVKLRDIATNIYRGSGITREQMTDNGIPCVRYGEIYTTYNIWFEKCQSHTNIENIKSPKYFEHGDILFAITGESIEDIAKSTAYLGYEKCLAGGDIVVLKHNQNPKYLSYVLSTNNAQKQKSKGKIKSKVVHSSIPSIEEIEIPLPSLEVQNRLVDVLDNFDAICKDLDIGLPAEIEARQKQYEYYRDMLLAFVETGDTILPDQTRGN